MKTKSRNAAGSTPVAGATQIVPGGPTKDFLNRDLTWLEFNRRVLHEALDERTPLLERAGFLAIYSSNLDEFYQKRVGPLKLQIEAGITMPTPDGMSAREQLTAIRATVNDHLRTQHECYTNVIRPKLAEQGVQLLNWDQLTAEDRAFCQQYYQQNLFPILTPLAVDPGHPFPFISNLSMSMGIMLRHPMPGTADGIGAAADAGVKEDRHAPAVSVFGRPSLAVSSALVLVSAQRRGLPRDGQPVGREAQHILA